MLKQNPIIAYTADCRGNLENCVYQNRIGITDTQTAVEAFRFDSVFAQYKNDYRSKENFLWSNALPMDCDNDHSDEPTDWITPEDIGFFFAGVPHIIHFSRHHMKRKGGKSPRPRFHVIFLIDPMTSEQEYVKLKKQIMGVYPYFDEGAIDSARFFIGTDPAEVVVVDGEITLNVLLSQIAANEDFLLNYREPIPDGKRNSTLTQIGACIIKRYGDTQEAYERFLSEAQVDYYTNFIKENPDWEYVGIYTDEGISGTNMKHREGFNCMIQDALDGKIDLIVTKSVSRFARNTVDSLTTIRKLKEAGCECLFQKENIMTFDSKGELLITIMSSLAQEESRSISENVTWGQRKRFSDGKVSIPYGQFLGYRKGADGLPEIVPEEAEIVRRIYRLFMQGKSTNAIAGRLTAEGIPTPGSKTQWQRATVESILSNEKYKGSALLQKSFTVDFLTKKTKANEGEVPQYYVEESHPAIIEPEEWQEVQAELAKRKRSHKRHRQTSVLSGKIFCGDCGDIYGSKVWHSTSKYRRVIWQCNAKFDGEQKCGTPHLYEEQIQRLFVAAMSEYLSDHEGTITDLQYAQRALTDTDFIDEDIRALEHYQELLSDMIRVCINSNASNTITEEEYHAKHGELCARFEQTEKKLNGLRQQRERMRSDAIAIGGMLFELNELDTLSITFNEKLWNAAIDRVTVYADERVVFHFKDGKDITELL